MTSFIPDALSTKSRTSSISVIVQGRKAKRDGLEYEAGQSLSSRSQSQAS